ncbi:MAG: Mpv17/PMP22 family protein [Chthoniobacterales bacterium]
MKPAPRRSPFALGWEAARANLVPALFIQALILALLVAYYWSPPAKAALDALAAYKVRCGYPFVLIAAVLAGAIVPELFLIAFFQRGRLTTRNFRNLLFTIPIWALDGSLVDLLYRSEAAWFGDTVTVSVVLAKLCVDQFGYNPFFAAPFGVLTYEWKNTGFTWESFGRSLGWAHYRDKIIPTLCATWAVWIPMMAIIYSLPLALQFPLFSLALVFWVLLLTYMTNSFAAKNSRADGAPDVVSSAVAEMNR